MIKERNVFQSLLIEYKGKPTIKVTVDGGTTFRSVLTNGEVPPADSLQIDKPINLEPGDKIRIFGTATSLECFLSILELT